MLVPCRGFYFFNVVSVGLIKGRHPLCSSPVGGFIFLIVGMNCLIRIFENNVLVPCRGFCFLNKQDEEYIVGDLVKQCSSPVGGFVFLMFMNSQTLSDRDTRPLSGVLFF